MMGLSRLVYCAVLYFYLLRGSLLCLGVFFCVVLCFTVLYCILKEQATMQSHGLRCYLTYILN